MNSLFTWKESSDFNLLLPYSIHKLGSGSGPFYYNCLIYGPRSQEQPFSPSDGFDWVDISVSVDDVNDMPNSAWHESKNSPAHYKLIKRIFRLKFKD